MSGHPSLTILKQAIARLQAAQAMGYKPARVGGTPEKSE